MAIGCSVAAFVRKEKPAFLSAITAIPGLLILIWMVASLLHL
jgi:hypothetical protein